MKKTINLFLLLIISLQGFAQKESYNWAFGKFSGLTWNATQDLSVTAIYGATGTTTLYGLPKPLTGLNMNALEGCFSLSDSNGNMMFYSDGTSVYNKNNVIMSNGYSLTGNASSTQSGIVIPYPNKPKKYAAITLGAITANNLSYSVIDMTANSGLGDVTTEKNKPFPGKMGTTGESVTSVRIPNSEDYWVLATGTGSPTYINAWRFSSTGPAATPVLSTLPTSIPAGYSYGYLKISPDTKHFSWTTFEKSSFYYGDFDVNTGKFSNIKSKSYGTLYCYGNEYSPDGSVLYINVENSLYAYKTSELSAATDLSTVTGKQVTGLGNLAGSVGAMQLAADGRIYCVKYNQTNMNIIVDPNNYDGFQVYQTANNFISGMGQAGLPTFSVSWFSVCYQPPVTSGTIEPAKTIISTLDRTSVPRNWSDIRTGSLILESKNKGLVLTRIATPETSITNPIEGMIVYDTTVKALKLYKGSSWNLLTQTCP